MSFDQKRWMGLRINASPWTKIFFFQASLHVDKSFLIRCTPFIVICFTPCIFAFESQTQETVLHKVVDLFKLCALALASRILITANCVSIYAVLANESLTLNTFKWIIWYHVAILTRKEGLILQFSSLHDLEQLRIVLIIVVIWIFFSMLLRLIELALDDTDFIDQFTRAQFSDMCWGCVVFL